MNLQPTEMMGECRNDRSLENTHSTDLVNSSSGVATREPLTLTLDRTTNGLDLTYLGDVNSFCSTKTMMNTTNEVMGECRNDRSLENTHSTEPVNSVSGVATREPLTTTGLNKNSSTEFFLHEARYMNFSLPRHSLTCERCLRVADWIQPSTYHSYGYFGLYLRTFGTQVRNTLCFESFLCEYHNFQKCVMTTSLAKRIGPFDYLCLHKGRCMMAQPLPSAFARCADKCAVYELLLNKHRPNSFSKKFWDGHILRLTDSGKITTWTQPGTFVVDAVPPLPYPEPELQFGLDLNHNLNFDIESVMQHLTQPLDATREMLNNVADCGKTSFWNMMQAVVAFFGTVSTSNSWIANTFALQSLLLHFGVSVGSICDRVIDLLKTLTGNQPTLQMGAEQFTDYLTAGGGLLFTVLGSFALQKIPTNTQIDLVMRRLKDLPMAIKGFAYLLENAREFLGYIVDLVREHVLGEQGIKINPFDEVNAWMSEVGPLCSIEIVRRVAYDAQLVDRINTLYLKGQELNRSFYHLKVEPSKVATFRAVLLTFTSVYQAALKSGAGSIGPRVEPFFVHFVGESGVGKSTLTWALLVDWFKAKEQATETQTVYEQTYFRKVGQEFWDGMNSTKKAVVYDDVGSLVDSTAKPNLEFLEAIYTSNIAPFSVHMADLTEKANTYFRAKLVIWSSNKSHFATPSLTFPDAVKRRIDLKVRVYPKPEFVRMDQGIARLDAVKAKVLDDETDAFLFDIIDKNDANDAILHQSLDYKAMREILFAGYDSKINNSEILIQKLARRMELHVGGDAPSPRTHPYLVGPSFGFHIDDENEAFVYHDQLAAVKACEFLLKDHPSRWFGRTIERWTQTEHHLDATEFFDLPYIHLGQPRIFKSGSGLRNTRCFKVKGNPLEAAIILRSGQMADYSFDRAVEIAREKLNSTVMIENCDCSGITEEGSLVDNSWRQGLTLENPVWSVRLLLTRAFATQVGQVLTMVGVSAGSIFLLDKVLSYTMRKQVKSKSVNRLESRSEHVVVAPRPKMESRSEKTLVRPNTRLETILESRTEKTTVTPRPSLEISSDVDVARLCEDFHPEQNEWRQRLLKMVDWDDRERTERMIKALLETSEGNHEDDIFCFKQICAELGIGTNKRNLDLQGTVDPGCQELIAKLTYRNMYLLERLGSDGKTWLLTGTLTFIKGRVALVNSHFLPCLSRAKRFRISSMIRPTPLEFDFSEIQYVNASDFPGTPLEHRDLALILFPRVVPQHTDIVSRFVDAGTAGWIQTVKRGYLIGYAASERMMARYYCLSDIRANDGSFTAGVDQETYHFRNYYEYPVDSVKGDCGALLMMSDATKTGKILGLHFAGRDRCHYSGMATPVTQECLNRMLSRFSSSDLISPAFVEHGDLPIELKGGQIRPQLELDGEFVPIGTIPLVPIATKSKIIESPLHGVFPVTCAPAILKPVTKEVDGREVIIDPRKQSLKKAGAPLRSMNSRFSKAIVTDLYELYDSHDAVTKRIFSLAEAIQGAEDVPYFKAMCRSTSGGYGWTEGSGKKEYLGDGQEFILDHPKVVAATTERITNARKGLRTPTVWIDTLKDERRPLSKIEAVKTRTFAVGPLDFNLVFRMYFGAFFAHLMENRIDFESSVGVNPYSADWNKIANALRNKGPHVIAGDFENFDGTLNAAVLWHVLDVIQLWYGGTNEENLIREVLFAEIVNSVHVCGGHLYAWTHSQPSGNPGTVIFNSVYNSFVMRYAFLHLAPSAERNMMAFRKNVSMVCLGDDNALCISPHVIEWYNQITISEALKTLGMTYTDEAKTGALIRSRDLSEIDFLKRRFRFDPERSAWVGPLAPATIHEMIMWTRKGLDTDQTTASTVSTAVYEASFHDEAFFNDFLAVIRPHIRKLAVRPVIMDYQSYATLDPTEGIIGSGFVDFHQNI